MGRFLTIEDITGTYYEDARLSEKYDWIRGDLDQNFPYLLQWFESNSIDWSCETSDVPRVNIRRWCERNLDGDVFAIERHESTFKLRNEDKPFDGGHQVSANWVEFKFELETDAMAFKLEWM